MVVVFDEKARFGIDSGARQYRAALYEHLGPHLGGVWLTSFGGPHEIAMERLHPGLKVLCNRFRLPREVYRQQFVWLHRSAFRQATVIRAEQAFAAPLATQVARHYGRPLLVRMGYSPSLVAEATGMDGVEVLRDLERRAASAADLLVVTTGELRRHLATISGRPESSIQVVPNYVECDVFTPGKATDRTPPVRVLSVGRLAVEKNFDSLIEAAALLPGIELEIAGEGPLRHALETRVTELRASNVRLVGQLSRDELLQRYRAADIYAQPSLVEGHPKTLLEAMACGLPTVGADVPGTRELIVHGVSGWITSTEPRSLGRAIAELAASAELRRRLGKEGRKIVERNYSLRVVAPAELAVLERAHRASASREIIRQPLRRPLASTGKEIIRAALRLLRRPWHRAA